MHLYRLLPRVVILGLRSGSAKRSDRVLGRTHASVFYLPKRAEVKFKLYLAPSDTLRTYSDVFAGREYLDMSVARGQP